jgi:folate-binding protein YgfZ
MVAIRGPGSEALGLPGAVAAEWPAVEGVDLVGTDIIPAGIATAGGGDLAALRIVCGVPAMGAELHDELIPAEAGIVDRSVSFTKGCYTGQELVARIDSRGSNVPRQLRGLVLAAAPDVGGVVLVDGAERGTVTSVASLADGRAVALAYIGRAVTPPASGTVAGIEAEILALPLAPG